MREMKDSGISWVGEIPLQWNVYRNKDGFINTKTIVGENSKNTPLLSLTTKGIKLKDIDNPEGKQPESFDTYQCVEINDLVMCLFDLDISAVFSGLSSYNGMISPAYKVLKCNERVIAKYADYWFRYIFDGRKFNQYAKNIRYTLTYDVFSALPMLYPSVGEQQNIADYLDTKCAQIDTIIAKEQSIIEKLQEYRQSIITEIVTSGLDPTENMVPSGVEWIDSIPLNWKTTRFTKSFEFFKGLNIKKTDLVDSGAGVVSYGQVHAKNNNGYSLQDGLIRYVAENLIDEKSLLQEGDFVFADTSEDLEGVGNSIHIDSSNELYAGYHTLVARCLDKSIYTKYFAFLFLTDIWRSQLRKNANGTKVYSVTQKMFKAVSCLVPPIEEQLKIVAYLEQKCDAIDRVISHKLTIINTLAEYKKSLIYEVVTGKKEVPHV